jgi:nephrocystin-4
MSRAAYAKLQSAKFPPILDRHGKLAEVIDGSTYIQFNLQKEEADHLTCNQIVFQFLAFSRTHESMLASRMEPRPKNIYFTFQFYRFPEFKTPK